MIPRKYRVSPEGAIASYDYTDIAEGTGYSVFSGMHASGAYMTTSDVIYSENIKSLGDSGTGAWPPQLDFEQDFDITFNMPKNIKGNIYCNIPQGTSARSSSDNVSYQYVIVEAYHYDGTTETSLGLGTSGILTKTLNTGSIGAMAKVWLIKIPINTLIHFKKGETLRFTVRGYWASNLGLLTTNEAIGHDPMNRPDDGEDGSPNYILFNEPAGGGTVSYISTKMLFYIPFVIDL